MSVTSKPSNLADLISAPLRRELLEAADGALRGRGLGILEGNPPSGAIQDLLAWCLTRAEVFHLDGKDAEALRLYDEVAIPALLRADWSPDVSRSVKEAVEEVVEENRMTAAFWADPGDSSEDERRHRYFDRRRVLGRRSADAATQKRLRVAARAAAAGKKFESLPVRTAAFVDARRQFRWSAARDAAGELALERFELSDFRAAAHAAILSCDRDVAKVLANRLRGSGDREAVIAASEQVLDVSHLQIHAIVAGEFLHALGDAVPEQLVPAVLHRAEAGLEMDTRVINRLRDDLWWGVVRGAAPMMEPTIADVWFGRAVTAASADEHGLTGAARAVGAMLFARGVEHVRQLAEQKEVLPPHFRSRLLDPLVNLAERYPDSKKAVRIVLFPPGQPTPWSLLQVAKSVGAKFDFTSELVGKALAAARSQVIRLGPDDPDPKSSGHMTRTTTDAAGVRVFVQLSAGIVELAAVAKNAVSLETQAATEVTTLICDLIEDPENVASNIEDLFSLLPNVMGQIREPLRSRAAELVLRFAADHRSEDHPLAKRPEADHPLNAFRFSGWGGWPQDARAAALIALARFATADLGVSRDEVRRLALSALSDPSPAVREAAFWSIELVPELHAEFLAAAVSALTAAEAGVVWAAASVVRRANITTTVLPSLIAALETNTRSGLPEVRRVTHELARRAAIDREGELPMWAADCLAKVCERLSEDVCKRVWDMG